MVIVAMFVTTKNPTMKTLMKVTTFKMTTMPTVVHRDLENDWSSTPNSTVHVVCMLGVLWSSRCCYLLLDSVVRPCIGLCSNGLFTSSHEILPFHFYSVKFFQVGLGISSFVPAHLILLVLDVAILILPIFHSVDLPLGSFNSET